MPYVNLIVTAGKTVEEKRAVVKGITDAIVQHLKVKPETVHIIIEETPRENLATAGALLSDR